MIQSLFFSLFILFIALFLGIPYYFHNFSKSEPGNPSLESRCLAFIENATAGNHSFSRSQYILSQENVHGECYFSESGYESAAKQFTTFVSTFSAAETQTLSVTPSEDTRVAIIKGHPRKFLVHISGTHGVEAYAGSAVQLGILDYIKSSGIYSENGEVNNQLPTIVLIHILNPFGFKYSRRYNENNVDLNRNFLTSEEWDFVKKRNSNYAGYDDLDSILNPTSKPTPVLAINEIFSLITMVKAVVKYGILGLKRGLVSGNYHKSNGLGFGGFERSKSAQNLIDLLINQLQIPEVAKDVILIDVHTGLGPTGVDTLMYSSSSEYDSNEKMERVFPVDFDSSGRVRGGIKVSEGPKPSSVLAGSHSDADEVAAGYELTIGTISKGFCNNFLVNSNKNKSIDHICMTEEFGTVPSILVGKFLMEENYATHWGSDSERNYYRGQLRNAFYVGKSIDWKRQVVSRGVQTFAQALEHLIKKEY